jgi:hypothetical protein
MHKMNRLAAAAVVSKPSNNSLIHVVGGTVVIARYSWSQVLLNRRRIQELTDVSFVPFWSATVSWLRTLQMHMLVCVCVCVCV